MEGRNKRSSDPRRWPNGGVEDISPPGLLGRLAAKWLNLWSGIVVTAAYVVDSVGWDAQNMPLAR
eukprot:8628204-Pyramimonas_sp.AAC.1